jgi:phospholipid/cholesterol/gamma-HCH transport system permease protein
MNPGIDAQAEGSASLALEDRGDRWVLKGVLNIHSLAAAEKLLGPWRRKRSARTLDLRELDGLDTPGALLLSVLSREHVELTGVRPEHAGLLALIEGLPSKSLPARPEQPRWRQLVIELGRGAEEAWRDAIDLTAFIAKAGNATMRALARPRELRLPSISRQIAETGIDALPIVGLLAVMISVVIGYQGVAQLRPYGGEDLTIDLVAVSVLREMGVLITAILVAGRSGSAFTAEIGVMRAREEVDALEVMGLEPIPLLVVPRVIALCITLPLLTFYANIMGLAGGAAACYALLDVSVAQYIERVHQSVDGSDLFVGLFKAPVFAFVIAAVGCMHGLRVRGSAESVGRETTRAVVKAIFLVIVLDALFSVWFEKLGL